MAAIKETENNKLTRMWRNWELHTLLIGTEDGAASVENSLGVPQNV